MSAAGNNTDNKTVHVAVWDNLKFLLILLVVVGHFVDLFTDFSVSFQSVFIFIYSFHVPLFFFISGLFFKDTKILSKTLFYLSTAYLLKILVVVIERILGERQPYFMLLAPDGPSWFMFSLAVFCLISYIIRKHNRIFIAAAVLIIACFVGYDVSVGDAFCLSRIIIFFPFYCLGTAMNSDRIIEKKKQIRPWLYVAAVIFILVWLYFCFFHCEKVYELRHLFTGRNSFSELVIDFGPLARLLCYVISFGMCASLIILMPDKKLGPVTNWGSHTIDVMFWHVPILLVLEKAAGIERLFAKGWPGKLGILLCAVLLTVLLCQLPIFRFPLKQIKKLCYRKQD